MPGTNAIPGILVVISPICLVENGKPADVPALSWAISMLFRNASSWRRKYFRLPPVSTMAIFIFQPSCLAFASHAAAIFLATSRDSTGRCSSAKADPASAVNNDTKLIESSVFFMDFPLEKVFVERERDGIAYWISAPAV